MKDKRKKENERIQQAMKAKKKKGTLQSAIKANNKALAKKASKPDKSVIEASARSHEVHGTVSENRGGKIVYRTTSTRVQWVDGLDPELAGQAGLRATITQRPKGSLVAQLQGEFNLEVRDEKNALQGGTNGTKAECLKYAKALGVPEGRIELVKSKAGSKVSAKK